MSGNKIVFCNLKARSLLNASETCKQFNAVLSVSQQLMKKLVLRIGMTPDDYYFKRPRNIENVIEKFLCELKLMKDCLQKSERKYDSISIFGIRDLVSCSPENFMIDLVFDILKQVAGSVNQIAFIETSFSDNNFFKVIQTIKNLKCLKFELFECYADQAIAVNEIVRPDNVATINEIYIEHVGKLSLQILLLFDTLTTLKVHGYEHLLDLETFESFLSMQKQLKVLHMSFLYTLFQTDKLTKDIKLYYIILYYSLTYGVENDDDHGLDQIHIWKSLESISYYTIDINQFFETLI